MEQPDVERDQADAPGAEHVPEVRSRLLEYYDAHRRDLPWREEDDPYRIWVSEVMLQQTRVDTVIPYYRRWMERFPRLDDLAAADQEEVLQHWKGLGYYSRARNLHRAAGIVRERHEGLVPDTVKELEELPGVGKYTAGAVASIAFQRPAPAVDGNVRRVLSRLYDLPDPGAADLRRRAAELVDPGRPGCFNQALMELGATLCTPSSPDCPACPLEDLCLARIRGTVEDRPRPRKRPPVREETRVVAIPVSADGRTVLVRRPEDGLLGGMWEFPSRQLPDGLADSEGSGGAKDETVARLATRAAEALGASLPVDGPVDLGTIPHTFTHLRMTYVLRLFPGSDLDDVPGGPSSEADAETEDIPDDRVRRVVPLAELDGLPLPRAQQRIGRRAVKALEDRLR